MTAELTNEEQPTSFQEAVDSASKHMWVKAMQNEMEALQENHTWDIKNLPKNKRAIPCKWVYKMKTNADGSVERYKARLVIKGCSQRKGYDYDQTFSPVAKSGTIRSVLSIAANEGMLLRQFDVSTAFLYGNLEEEIYMEQPEGFNDGTGRVCRLNKSLYGLKQAPRCWNKRFGNFLIRLGFIVNEADPCLYIKENGSNKTILALYVDDGLVASTNQTELFSLMNSLESEFKITHKAASYFLGFEISHRKDGSIKVSQEGYARKILHRFGMSECKPVSTPIPKESIQSGKVSENDSNQELHFPYRQAVGALMYLMTGTRPDIAYAVGVASRCLENPKPSDVVLVKRIFRYLKGTIDYGIIYKHKFKKGILETFSDADLGGDEQTGRSTTGVVCIYAGGAVTWLELELEIDLFNEAQLGP